MQSVTTSQTGTGSSPVVAVSYFTNPFNIGLGAVLSGAATFTVQYSFEDPMDAGYSASSATWFSVPNMSSLSASTAAALVIPCRAVRVTIASGTGTVTLYVQQAGTR